MTTESPSRTGTCLVRWTGRNKYFMLQLRQLEMSRQMALRSGGDSSTLAMDEARVDFVHPGSRTWSE